MLALFFVTFGAIYTAPEPVFLTNQTEKITKLCQKIITEYLESRFSYYIENQILLAAFDQYTKRNGKDLVLNDIRNLNSQPEREEFRFVSNFVKRLESLLMIPKTDPAYEKAKKEMISFLEESEKRGQIAIDEKTTLLGLFPINFLKKYYTFKSIPKFLLSFLLLITVNIIYYLFFKTQYEKNPAVLKIKNL